MKLVLTAFNWLAVAGGLYVLYDAATIIWPQDAFTAIAASCCIAVAIGEFLKDALRLDD